MTRGDGKRRSWLQASISDHYDFHHRIKCIRLAIPQPIERQRIGNQFDTATILARADVDPE